MREEAKVKNNEARKREFEDRVEKKRRTQMEGREAEVEGAPEQGRVKRRVRGEGSESKEDEMREIEKALEEHERLEKRRRMGGSNGENEKLERIAEEFNISNVSVAEEALIENWIAEMRDLCGGEEEVEESGVAWDDVNGGGLPLDKVMEARREEVDYIEGRGIWELRPIRECWDVTGKKPVSVRWVDTNKGFGDGSEGSYGCQGF